VNKQGRTAASMTAAKGDLEMLVLLGQSADLNLADKDGATPLDFARKSRSLNCTRYLEKKEGATFCVAVCIYT
jgi:ankyrin repeat protein